MGGVVFLPLPPPEVCLDCGPMPYFFGGGALPFFFEKELAGPFGSGCALCSLFPADFLSAALFLGGFLKRSPPPAGELGACAN